MTQCCLNQVGCVRISLKIFRLFLKFLFSRGEEETRLLEDYRGSSFFLFFRRVPFYRKNGTTTFVAHLRCVYRGGPQQWAGTIVVADTSHNIH